MGTYGWNPWHGCHKLSEGCRHCYVYRMDARHEKDSSIVTKTGNFNLPVRKGRDGSYKLARGLVYTCFTSDFFVEDADEWRQEAWAMMAARRDLDFLFITKRPDRAEACFPPDWGLGYPNVTIGCTVENQDRADYRLPIFSKLPVWHKFVACEPLLEHIDLSRHISKDWLELLVAGGESGLEARPCNYNWVLSLREQCMAAGVRFNFRQTGAKFIKDGKLYIIPRKLQGAQARKAGIDTR